MKIECPNCKFTSSVSDSEISENGTTGTCPKCKMKFIYNNEKWKKEATSIDDKTSPSPEGDTKSCPLCGEKILSVAKKCKHCNSMIDSSAQEHIKVVGQFTERHLIKSNKNSSGSIVGKSIIATITVIVTLVAIVMVAGYSNYHLSGRAKVDDIDKMRRNIQSQLNDQNYLLEMAKKNKWVTPSEQNSNIPSQKKSEFEKKIESGIDPFKPVVKVPKNSSIDTKQSYNHNKYKGLILS